MSAPARLALRDALCSRVADPRSERPERLKSEQPLIRGDKVHAWDRERHGTVGPKRKRETKILASTSGSGMTLPSANGIPAAVAVPVSGEATPSLVMDPLERSGHGDVMDPSTSSTQSIPQGMPALTASGPVLHEGGCLADQSDCTEVAVGSDKSPQSAGTEAAKPGSWQKSIDFGSATWVDGAAAGEQFNSGLPADGNAPALPSADQRAPEPHPMPQGGSMTSQLVPGTQTVMGPADAALWKLANGTAPLRTAERSPSHPPTKEMATTRAFRSVGSPGMTSAPTHWGVAQHATASGKDPAAMVPASSATAGLPVAQAVHSVTTSLAGQQENPGRGSVTQQTFTALDTATSKADVTWSHLSARHAEAGYQDPVLGWVNVRAQSDSSGIHAALVPGSAAAEQSLRGHLDGLQSFLHNQQSSVLSVQVSKPEAFAMGQGSGNGQGQNPGHSPTQNSPGGGGAGPDQEAGRGSRRDSTIAGGSGSAPGLPRGIDRTAVKSTSEVRFLGGHHVSVIA